MLGLREQQNPPTRANRINGSLDQAIATDRQDGCVRTTAFGLPAHLRNRISARGVNSIIKSEVFRYCKPLLIQIGNDYPRPCPFGQYTQYDADRTLSDYKNCFFRLKGYALDALHARIHWLNERGLLKRNFIGNAHSSLLNNPTHHTNIFGEAAA